MTQTTQHDGPLDFDGRSRVHLGLTHGGGYGRPKFGFVNQCRAPCGRAALMRTIEDDGSLHSDQSSGVQLGLTQGGRVVQNVGLLFSAGLPMDVLR